MRDLICDYTRIRYTQDRRAPLLHDAHDAVTVFIPGLWSSDMFELDLVGRVIVARA